eukprot:gene3839-1127_t
MKQVLFVGDRMLQLARGGTVHDGKDRPAAVALDAKKLDAACAKGIDDKRLFHCVKTNNLTDFMYRCRGEHDHPFVDAASYWTWARNMSVDPISKVDGNIDVLHHRPAEYVALSDAHPAAARTRSHGEELVIHIRTMAPSGSYDRAPRIPVLDGWDPYGGRKADNPDLKELNAMCLLFLFTPGLRCPNPGEDGECAMCIKVPGVRTLGTCFCPWQQCLTAVDADGVPSYRETLRRRICEWEERAAFIGEWERNRRQFATLGGIWDELRLDRERCLRHPSEHDRAFITHHYGELYQLADSLFCREALEAIRHFEMIDLGKRIPKVDHVPKESEKEASSISALAHAEAVAAADAALTGDADDAAGGYGLELDADEIGFLGNPAMEPGEATDLPGRRG